MKYWLISYYSSPDWTEPWSPSMIVTTTDPIEWAADMMIVKHVVKRKWWFEKVRWRRTVIISYYEITKAQYEYMKKADAGYAKKLGFPSKGSKKSEFFFNFT